MESVEARRLFVGGLSYETNDASLGAYFGNWGPIVESSVKKFPQGNSRGFGFVTFGSVAIAENVFAMQPHSIDGKKVDIRRSQDKQQQQTSSANSASTPKVYDPEELMLRKLFIAGLDEETNEDDLREFFTSYGDIEDSKVYKHPDSGKSRGFGFVTFARSASVDEAQRNRPHMVKGRKSETRRATPKHLVGKPECKISTKKVYLGPPEGSNKAMHGLGEEISDDDLKTYFGQFGTVTNIQQLRWEDTGKKRGYGYIDFADEDHVDKIVLVRNHIIKGRQLEAKKGLSRDQMQQCEVAKRSSEGFSDYDNMPGVSATADVVIGAGYGYGGGENYTGPRGTKRSIETDDKMLRKLYIGGLDHNTTKDDLHKYFGQYGEVEDANVKTFPDSGKSRGFGFVTFANASGVDNVQMCRPHSVGGKTVDTKRFSPNGDSDDGKVKKVWIGPPESEKSTGGGHSGLTEELSDEDITNHFQQYGVITKIDQLRWPDSKRKRGYGYIEFEDADTVDKIVMIKIHTIGGVRLEVKRNVERNKEVKQNQRSSGMTGGMVIGPQDDRSFKKLKIEKIDPENVIMRRVFAGGLNLNTTKQEVTEYFEKFGETEDIYLPTHKDTGRSKGYAFITFQKSAFVDKVQRARPHQLGGQNLETIRATPKENLGNPEAEAKTKKIFIGGPSDLKTSGHSGLTDDLSDEDLEEYFGQYGTVTRVDQKKWPDTGKKKGFGYIEFDDEDAVDKIVLLGIHIVKGVKIEARKGLSRDQLAKKGESKNQSVSASSTNHNMPNMPGPMASTGYGNYGGSGYATSGGGYPNSGGGYANSGGGNNMNQMNNMMGNMQNMMSGMASGAGGNDYGGNMQNMQNMMSGMQNNMQNNMGSGNSNQNMEMMGQMMKMQQMMSGMTGGGTTANKDQMMQTMMMSMMTMMYNNMSSQGNNQPNNQQQLPHSTPPPSGGTPNYNYNWGPNAGSSPSGPAGGGYGSQPGGQGGFGNKSGDQTVFGSKPGGQAGGLGGQGGFNNKSIGQAVGFGGQGVGNGSQSGAQAGINKPGADKFGFGGQSGGGYGGQSGSQRVGYGGQSGAPGGSYSGVPGGGFGSLQPPPPPPGPAPGKGGPRSGSSSNMSYPPYAPYSRK